MRPRHSLLVLCCAAPALALAAGPRPAAAPPRKPRVAVMDMRPLGTEAVKAEVLSEVALTEASAVGGLEVVGRSDINALLGLEKQKQMLGCGEDTSCLAEIGGALGVDYLLTGSLGRLGALYRVDLRLVDARKARVLGRVGESVSKEEEKLVGAVQLGVRQLLAPIVPESATPNPTAATGPVPSAVHPERSASAEAEARSRGAPTPIAATTRFDGEWYVRMVCPPADRAKGYRLMFPATVANGQLDGRSGPEGSPGSVYLHGPIAADGAAVLVVDGVTGDPSHSLHAVARGTRVRFRVKAQFEDRAGTGERLEHRPCSFAFTRP